MERISAGWKSALAGAFPALIFLSFSYHFVANFDLTAVPRQKAFVKNVHDMFPDKTTYIDGCSAIPSFKKAGFFMSTWGMENYLKRNEPIMRNILIREQPKFLLAKIPSLDLSTSRENEFTKINYGLLKEDWEVLKNNFVHHWNIVWVPGKIISFEHENEKIFEILIPSEYSLEGNGGVLIDQRRLKPGGSIYLDAGWHTILSSSIPNKVTLKYGNHLSKPNIQIALPSFYGF